MYGLVNKAIQQMVCSNHGTATWNRIKAAAEVELEGFISNRPYPDELTYRLVAAASEALDEPAEAVLKAFGEHWVLHTALQSYGPMLKATGKTLREFLIRLPHLHTRVELIYPDLKPPQFSCHEVGDKSVDLHYWTTRPPGLEPFVEGLLYGLGKMFSTPVRVELVAHRADGNDRSIFRVSWDDNA